MAALMADGLGPRAEASDLELRREGKSYTADTVEAIHEAFPEDELWLLMGTDMFLTIQNWYQPERIFQYAGGGGLSRSQEDTQEIFAQQSQYLEETYHARTTVVPLPEVREIASRDLRRMLASEWTGGNVDPAQYLWEPVYGYILKEGLFGTQADLKHLSDKHLRAISFSMVQAKRLPHIKGTEETAAALAAFWGLSRRKPAGQPSSTTAPSTGPWSSTWRPARNTGWPWMSWSVFRSNSSTPSLPPPWPAMYLGSRRRSARPSSPTPPAAQG